MTFKKAVRVEHPEAVKALIASVFLDGKSSDQITQYLNENNVNRRLFVLSSVLRKADRKSARIGGNINETA